MVDLEHELERKVHRQQQQHCYQVKNDKVVFKQGVSKVHKTLKAAFIPWLLSSQLRNLLSVPFMLLLIIPFLLVDFSLSIYQHLCFRLYQIPRIKRGKYFVFDRHLLMYLNLFQKLNCCYCSYINGVIGFAREVAARNEQYWCPIKHAHKLSHPHRLYMNFSDYGDGVNFHQESQKLRQSLKIES